MRAPQVVQSLRSRLGRRTPWVLTGLFWLIFTATSLVIYAAQGPLKPLVILNGLLSPALVSFTYGFLSPLPWQWTGDTRPQAGIVRGTLQGLLYHAVIIFFLTGLSYWLSRHDGPLILGPGGHPLRFWQFASMQVIIGSCLMTLIGGIIAMGETTHREKRDTARRLQEAQDVLLRGQLAPHALFNALNGLAELVRQDPARAETAILDLSELLRVLLRQSKRAWSTLAEERDIAERYLRMETLRLGARLRVRWEWDAALEEASVPCLLLQPLIENALKHGIAPDPGGGELVLRLMRKAEGLHLEVANTGRPVSLVLGEGVGITNLEARLRLAYEDRASFQLIHEGEWTRAIALFPEAP
jgi:two-component system sensor histidine kinase AlgZ